jgi:uncharacterized phage protein (TIGR01671 family)
MRENMGMYRGKRIDNGEWVYGYYVKSEYYFDGKCKHFIIGDNGRYDDDGLYPMHIVGRYTVGEYTGLTDKNGKRIFEGDVVSGLFLYALPINGVCVFKEGAFGLEWERGKAKEFTPFTSMCNVQYEVVGNIHDNTELKGAVNDN